MTITYSIAIDRDDNGVFTDLNDNISSDVLALRWRIGMDAPYDHMAGIARAEITVYNPSGAYSPELNTLLPGKRLRIQSDDGMTTRTHFIGYITEILPEPGDTGGRTARIIVEDVSCWFAENRVRLPIQTDVRADEVISSILQQLELRYPLLNGYLIIGQTGYNALDSDKLSGAALSSTLEAGISTFAYIGDTWADGIAANRAIEELARSEQGYFFINRTGEAIFYHRHHTLNDDSPAATFSDDMRGMAYSYGANIVNRVQVRVIPRSIGATHTLLWELEHPIKLVPGAIRQIRCQYQDDNDNPAGALQIDTPQAGVHYLANGRIDGIGFDKTSLLRLRVLETGMSATTLELENPTTQTMYITTLQLRGTPLHRGDSLLFEHSDRESMTFYGLTTLALELPALTSLDEADNLARYEISRRKAPRGTVQRLMTDARQHPTETLSLTFFDRIRIEESQTGHSADYLIIAESHEVTKGGKHHRVQWTLQPADSDIFAIVGTSQPDGTAALAY